ncbi:hypothetical protein [Haliscomenobacter sp.]|uniref:hypothetical protein n=1 Tax=Haliscomenobacter sp. TaxID=2717303 RepID=UPI003364D872
MKKLQSLIFAVFTCIVLFAQSPPSINYQAIAWNLDGTPKALKTINVEFKIHTLKSDGAVEFSEKFLTSTNDQGLFTLAIGSTKLSEFQNVDWGKGPKYLEVIVDNLSVGTTQILSVPYALYAEKTNLKAGPGISVSGNTITNTGDRDTTNEIQRLSLSGTQLTLSKNGGTVTLPASGGSGSTYSAGTGISISPTNVISTDLKAGEGISIVGNTISNTNTGGGGTGTTYTAGTGISITGNTISNSGDGDADKTNEIQELTLNSNNNVLTLSKGGGSVTLPTGSGGGGTTYTAGSGINITGNTISANEQQALSLVGSKLTLSPNGGSVDLPSIDKQILNYADGVLSISNGNSVSLPGVDYLTVNATGAHFGASVASATSFFEVEKIDRLIVPNSGIYMVFFSAWIIGLDPAKSEATLRVATADKAGTLLHVVTGGQSRGNGVGVWVAQLDKGEQLRMTCNVSGVGSSFRIDEHWMALVRIR